MDKGYIVNPFVLKRHIKRKKYWGAVFCDILRSERSNPIPIIFCMVFEKIRW